MVIYVHEFTVEPKGSAFDFPIDMMRYDRCFPCEETGSKDIARTFGANISIEHPYKIKMKHWGEKSWKPTFGRWESFCWKVTDHKKEKL